MGERNLVLDTVCPHAPYCDEYRKLIAWVLLVYAQFGPLGAAARGERLWETGVALRSMIGWIIYIIDTFFASSTLYCTCTFLIFFELLSEDLILSLLWVAVHGPLDCTYHFFICLRFLDIYYTHWCVTSFYILLIYVCTLFDFTLFIYCTYPDWVIAPLHIALYYFVLLHFFIALYELYVMYYFIIALVCTVLFPLYISPRLVSATYLVLHLFQLREYTFYVGGFLISS